jgi:2-polyprenyl-3-methyl-5-hydroxy-6-metoxy-1,4-benzoquinol methylase
VRREINWPWCGHASCTGVAIRHTMSDGFALQPRPACLLCGTTGTVAYSDLPDRLYGTPGRWRFRRCPADGLYWLDPRPRPDELDKVYRTYFTHDGPHEDAAAADAQTWWSKTIDAGAFAYRRERVSAGRAVAGRLLAFLPPIHDRFGARLMWLRSAAPGRLLDVGCGSGHFLARMRTAGWQVVGVEPDPSAAQIARDRLGLPVVVGTLEALDPAEGFDAITLSHVIEHVPDPVATLRDCWRRLRPGGRLLALTPNVNGFGHRVFGATWPGLQPPFHLQVFSPSTLALCARDAQILSPRVRTTARMAPIIWDMRQSAGRGNPRRRRWRDRAGALALLLMESVLGGAHGEELVLVATKSSVAPQVSA